MFNTNELQSLIDTSCPFDEPKVRLLEQLVQHMLSGGPAERQIAHEVLGQLKANPESWRVVGTILQVSKDSNTRFYALSILETCINTRWNVLPEEQKAGIKQYVTDMVIEVSRDDSLKNAKHFATKVNETLIQIIKHEWPHRWPSFVPDLCNAARTNQSICENGMKILSLLSEEIFDFGADYMTSQRVQTLMVSLNEQFQIIYDLCMFVLQSSVTATAGGNESTTTINVSLVSATLQCLSHFVKWIPEMYLFETGLIGVLLQYFWESTQHRIECVRCLTEIASLKVSDPQHLATLNTTLWKPLIQRISQLSDTTLDYETRCHANSRIFWETFYCQLAICLTSFLKNHREDVCELSDNNNNALILFAFEFLIKLTSRINHEETFKVCVDYWHSLSESLFNDVRTAYKAGNSITNGTAPPLILEAAVDPMVNGVTAANDDPLENPELYSMKLRTYQPALISLRKALVMRMARPQEVCIHYDEETGTVDRDYETDTDEVALYNVMRETFIFLTNLGGEQTQTVMIDLLKTFTEDAKNPNQKNWNPTTLSRLCWAIGSVSGAMTAEREKKFLVQIIRDLLLLCEHKRGKENKAIVASMIMYVFGQYPRFLRRYVRFLETVVGKLFEFMKETFQGVPDMACETFLKVSQKCAKSLGNPPPEDPRAQPLIDGILPQIPNLYKVVETPKQQLMLFEGVAHIIRAVANVEKRGQYIAELMKTFNTEWQTVMVEMQLNVNSDAIYQPQVARKLTEILRINERVASATGTAFSVQLMSIYKDALAAYNLYSSKISAEVAQQGPFIMSHGNVKALRSVKRATLLLVQTFVESASTDSNDKTNELIKQQVVEFILPPLLEPVLKDYGANVPQARDFEVLSLLSTLITRLGAPILPQLPRIFELVFDCTLDMIKADFHSFPDHRTKFYDLLKACNDNCFEGLFTLPETQQRYFVESLVWAIKHEQPAVAEQGLSITQNLLRRLGSTNQDVRRSKIIINLLGRQFLDAKILLPFCRAFYWSIFTGVFGVLTDTLHKSGFQLQTIIIMHLIQLVDLGRVEDAECNITRNDVMSRLADLLMINFVNLNRKQVEAFVLGLFNKSGSPRDFTRHIRDFLVTVKEFAGSDELFEEERLNALQASKELEMRRRMQVPGMVPQYTAAETTHVEDLE